MLEGADGETVKAIVDFCYTGRINLTGENVGTFLAIASSVDFDLLQAECCQFYADKLCVTNCVDAFIAADKYGYADVRQKAFDLICCSFENLSSAEIQKMDHQLLRGVLKCHRINATEELVFNQLVEWCQNEGNDREQYMPELLKRIRLEHLSHQVRFANHFQYFSPVHSTLNQFTLICSFSVTLWSRFMKSLIVRSSYLPSTNDDLQTNAQMFVFVDRFCMCSH